MWSLGFRHADDRPSQETWTHKWPVFAWIKHRAAVCGGNGKPRRAFASKSPMSENVNMRWTRSVPSGPAVTMGWPSDEQAALRTVPTWPRSLASSCEHLLEGVIQVYMARPCMVVVGPVAL